MNLRIINLIISREYLTRVKKKSFLLVTFIAPIFMAAVCVLPSLLMILAKEEAQKIAVVDNSGIAFSYLENTDEVEYEDMTCWPVDSLKSSMKEMGFSAVLQISTIDSVSKSVTAHLYSEKPVGVEATGNIKSRIDDAVEAYRIGTYNISGLEQIMADVRSDIVLTSYKISEDGRETISESTVYMFVSMFLGMAIYLFISMFSGMVVSSVIEEKASRVVEVLTSSVKATELMFGKIIGIAAVALTQFFLWIVLTIVLVGTAYSFLGPEMMSSVAESSTMPGIDAQAAMPAPSGLDAVITTILDLPIGTLLIGFFIYFVFGYLLYASLFAAIGSAAESESDTQQLQMPLTIPLLIGFFISFYAFKAPDSQLVFWGSMIPFTSPIVMLARIPYGVPTWELVTSIAILVATFFVCGWISAKIYRVGILIFGKKGSFKDLWNWFKQS
ncbi:MAG: ABC transporter permease [Bacteroidales bacterium]|nr:ABC transporter permease [Bacteroidales bacterium]